MIAEMINLGMGIYIDSDGGQLAVAAMFDRDGNECEAPDAVSAVAGTEGRWYCIDLSSFSAGAYQ